MARLESLPVVGPWVSRVGQVVDIMSVDCTPSTEMWVTAFFYNQPQLWWSLFKPEALDQAFDRLGRPHKSRRRMRGSAFQAILPQEQVKPGLSTAVFKLGLLAQRIGWYFLIADVGTQFAVNWTSTAYQWAGCIGVERGPCQLIQQDGDLLAPGFDGVPFWFTEFDPDDWSIITGIQIPPMTPHGLAFNLVVSQLPPPLDQPGHVSAQVRRADNSKVVMSTDPLDAGAQGGSSAAQYRRFTVPEPLPINYEVHMRCEGGYANLGGSSFSATGNPLQKGSILEDP